MPTDIPESTYWACGHLIFISCTSIRQQKEFSVQNLLLTKGENLNSWEKHIFAQKSDTSQCSQRTFI